MTRHKHTLEIAFLLMVIALSLVANMALLSVHSAAKDAVAGRADVLVVQNVMATLEVASSVAPAKRMKQGLAASEGRSS